MIRERVFGHRPVGTHHAHGLPGEELVTDPGPACRGRAFERRAQGHQPQGVAEEMVVPHRRHRVRQVTNQVPAALVEVERHRLPGSWIESLPGEVEDLQPRQRTQGNLEVRIPVHPPLGRIRLQPGAELPLERRPVPVVARVQVNRPGQQHQVPVSPQLPHPFDVTGPVLGAQVELPPGAVGPPPVSVDHGVPVGRCPHHEATAEQLDLAGDDPIGGGQGAFPHLGRDLEDREHLGSQPGHRIGIDGAKHGGVHSEPFGGLVAGADGSSPAERPHVRHGRVQSPGQTRVHGSRSGTARPVVSDSTMPNIVRVVRKADRASSWPSTRPATASRKTRSSAP